jgi:ubiquinone/menaquinone biosynthesis C-methylase UbiE
MLAMSTDSTAPQPTDALIDLLDVADSQPGAAGLRAHTYDLLQLSAGQAVVDVGCGTGRAVAELADRGTRSVGVDPDPRMIAVARRRWPECDLRAGTAEALPLDGGSVAGYRADKVFHELADPERALVEARRVLAPGGRIVLLGQDWDAFMIDSVDPGVTRTIVRARADTVPNPRVTRRYRALLLDAGFTGVAIEAFTAVFTDATMLPMLTGLAHAARAAEAITDDQAAAWIAEQTGRAQAGRVFLGVPLFIAAATRA